MKISFIQYKEYQLQPKDKKLTIIHDNYKKQENCTTKTETHTPTLKKTMTFKTNKNTKNVVSIIYSLGKIRCVLNTHSFSFKKLSWGKMNDECAQTSQPKKINRTKE